MILEDVRYYQPETIREAVDAYREAAAEGLSVHYMGGGTEITTHARDGKLAPGALIDIKRIPEANGISRGSGVIRFGAAVTLTRIADSGDVPLLSATARRIADRTTRNSITLGGNIAGMLPYREAVLAFLIYGGTFEVTGPEGTRTAAARELFDRRVRLEDGEFIVALSIPESASTAPWYYTRRERDGRVDYPLVTFAAGLVRDAVAFAVAGAFLAPIAFSVPAAGVTRDVVVNELKALGLKYRTDMRGSAEYRRALTERACRDALDALGKGAQ